MAKRLMVKRHAFGPFQNIFVLTLPCLNFCLVPSYICTLYIVDQNSSGFPIFHSTNHAKVERTGGCTQTLEVVNCITLFSKNLALKQATLNLGQDAGQTVTVYCFFGVFFQK